MGNIIIRPINQDILIKEYFISSTWSFDDYNTLIKKLYDEMQSINPKSYFYEIIADGEGKGIIGYNVISMMNEYKLADLHYLCEKEFLNEALSLLLNDAITKNFVVKMICKMDLHNEYEINCLKQNKFIYSKDLEDDFIELKITKPIYLEK